MMAGTVQTPALVTLVMRTKCFRDDNERHMGDECCAV